MSLIFAGIKNCNALYITLLSTQVLKFQGHAFIRNFKIQKKKNIHCNVTRK